MNREQAKKAVNDIHPGAADGLDWPDPEGTIREGEVAARGISDPDEHEKALKILAALRQHRDYLRTEDEAMAVWREVFVARCATAATGVAAADANDAETFFRRRFASHLKAVG